MLDSNHITRVFKKFVVRPWRRRDTRLIQCMRMQTHWSGFSEFLCKIMFSSLWCILFMFLTSLLSVCILHIFLSVKRPEAFGYWVLYNAYLLLLLLLSLLRVNIRTSRKKFPDLFAILTSHPWSSLPENPCCISHKTAYCHYL